MLQEQLKKLDGFYTKVLESMESKKKSPYELDLEVMDRIPDITPKVGDWVKIKSKEWYEKWKDRFGTVPVRFSFVKDMKEHCGGIYKVRYASSLGDFPLDEVGFAWSMEMFEQVYPQEEYTVHKTIFGEIVIPKVKGPTVMEAIHSKEGRISSHIRPKDDTLLGCYYKQMFDKAVSSYMPYLKETTITKETADWPNILPGIFQPGKERSESERQKLLEHLRSKWRISEESETKLRIINTNQLIKIEKL